MKIFCPAKINLFLKVLGKRDDGYHALESLLAFTDLNDELEIVESKKFYLEITGEFSHLLDSSNNLFVKIMEYFCDEFAIDDNIHVKIQKNIPIGGGLGGGSSNAASFMIALNDFYKLKLSKEKLQKISLKFGSDIAFFFEDSASIIKGRGEIITNYPKFESISTLLVNPKIFISTKDIFENFGTNYSTEITTEELLKRDVFDLTKSLANDLENPAVKCAPAIKKIIENLKDNGAILAKMSGSGSSCFGIFNDKERLKTAQQFFNQNFPDFFVRKIKILSTKK